MLTETPTSGTTPNTSSSQPQTPPSTQPQPSEQTSYRESSTQSTTPSETQEQPGNTFSPETVLQDYEAYIRNGGTVDTNNQPYSTPPAKGLNSKRKYDGLDESEKIYFDQMSTPAYEYLYPRHLKAKEHEQEIERLRNQTKQAQEISFYDQEGAWEITPEYKNISNNLQSLNWEVNFWQKQLGEIEEILALPPEQQKDAKIAVLDHWDRQTGDPVFVDMPATRVLKANIISALSKAHNLATSYGDKLTNIQSTFKNKHGEYVKSLKSVETELFKGFPQDKLQPMAEKKLQNWPEYARSRPEVQMLAKAWVLFDALIHMLNKNKAGAMSGDIRKNITASSGPAGGGSGGSANGAEPTANEILQRMKQQGMRGIKA